MADRRDGGEPVDHMDNGHGRDGAGSAAARTALKDNNPSLPGSRGVIADARQYEQMVQRLLPRINKGALLFRAFIVGGALSLVGQVVLDYFTAIEPTEGQAYATTLATMILLGAVATAFGMYDRLGEFAGFGAAVPITGFANSMVSAAMDFRREGLILGMGTKMFIVAGPVIVFGLLAGMTTGFFAWLFKTITAVGTPIG